ncbi:MAG: hypothetical protein IPG84_00895 [Betaproteobacteria bacterium]|nr:hypothetical protein [Betaproteobacteria bacterium]
MRALADAGVRWYDRIVRFQAAAPGGVRATWPGRLRRALGIHPDADLDGIADASSMLAELARHRPDVVAGYPSTLRYLADEALARGAPLPALRVVTSGARCSTPPLADRSPMRSARRSSTSTRRTSST